jgi:hypothetical protein
MDRKSVWIVAGAILLGTVLLSLSQAVAQRNFRTEPGPADGRPARYQVVNVTESEIIIMDVTSGDLYAAKPRDVKPYEARPQPARFRDQDRFEFKDKADFRPPPKDKDKPFFDKGRDKFEGPQDKRRPFQDKDKDQTP